MSCSVKRTSDIEEWSNIFLIHPLSGWLVTRLAQTAITPNMVSLIGMGCGILAAVFYYHFQEPLMATAGFFCMFLWHILDGSDGQLARLTKCHSETGKILDGVCDYVTFISVYIGLGMALSAQGTEAWILIITAGILHAVQSGAYEAQREEYDYWSYNKETAALPNPETMTSPSSGLLVIFHLLHRIYTRMQWKTSGLHHDFRQHLHHSLQQHPEKSEAIRKLYRTIFAPVVKQWSILCANYRTLAIFVACLMGQPLYFFWFEIAFLTPILIILILRQKTVNALFCTKLNQLTEKTD